MWFGSNASPIVSPRYLPLSSKAYPFFSDVDQRARRSNGYSNHLQWEVPICIRCLSVLKLEYQRLYERAYLGVYSFDLMTAACDLAMDKGQFSAFASAINDGLRVPWYVVWDYEMKLAKHVPAAHEWIRRPLYNHHTRVFEITLTVLMSLPHCNFVIQAFRSVDGVDENIRASMIEVIEMYQHILQTSLLR